MFFNIPNDIKHFVGLILFNTQSKYEVTLELPRNNGNSPTLNHNYMLNAAITSGQQSLEEETHSCSYRFYTDLTFKFWIQKTYPN